MFQEKLFDHTVTQITFDPTNLILACSEKDNKTVALSIDRTKVHYVYVELEKKKYCTVAAPLMPY